MKETGMPRTEDPDQREALLRARGEIMETLQRHGLAGVCVLAAGGSLEVLTGLDAPWCKLSFINDMDGDAVGVRLHAALADYAGNRDAMNRHLAMTAGFASALAEVLGHTAMAWIETAQQVDSSIGADHTPLERVRHQ